MEWMFTIVPIFIAAVFVIVIGTIVVRAARGVAEWSHNNAQPVLSVPAKVVSRRSELDGRMSSNTSRGYLSTTYYATFEAPSGQRMEFEIRGDEYGLLAEGDDGTLTHQGTRYHGFRRTV